MHTDTIDPVFVFYQKVETKMLHAELTDKIISSFFKVYYENQVVGDYFTDIIADQVILEIKAEGLREENKAQLIRNPKSVSIRQIRVIRVPFSLMNTISSIQTTMLIT